MLVQVDGQLKEWFEQDGRHDLADSPSVEIDDAEYQKALTHCVRLHPDYSSEKSHAWAAFVVAAKNRVSASTREIIGGESANSLTRVSGEVEKVTKEFRAFKGEFASIADALGVVKDEVTEAVDSQTKAVWIALDASAKIQYECTNKLESVVENGLVNMGGSITTLKNELKEFFKVEFDARRSDELESIGRERRKAVWLWVWRISVALILCGLLTAKLVHGQTTTQIRALDPTNGFPSNVTGTSGGGHYGLDVNCISGCSGGGGGGGTSSNFGSTFPTAGTAIGVKNGLNMVNLAADSSSNLLVAWTAAQHIIVDSFGGSATLPVTNAGTFAVQATLAAETTKVIGTVNQGTSPWVVSGAVTPGTGVFQVGPTSAANTVSNPFFFQPSDGTHGATFNSTTFSSKFAQDINLLGTLGTAFSTAGKVDVKAADGDVFVRSNAAATFPVTATIAAAQTIAVTNTGTFATQSNLTGNAAVISGQQSVTGSAVVLATNTLKNICVKALIGNTINVYIGPSGVSTSTGMELAPGDSWCGPVTNSNVLFVIASTTGASVSWIGSN